MNTQNIDLTDYLLAINDKETMNAALTVLLSKAERCSVENRLKIIQMIKEGKSHREIAKQLKVGIATVTRGSHVIKTYNL